MKIAFVFPPFDHKKFEEDIDVVSREFAEPPPLGLAYAAAIAEKAGHEAIIIDANCCPRLSQDDVLARINAFGPDVVGYMLTAYMFQQTLAWITQIKAGYPCPVIVGNVLMELYPREVMAHEVIDYGIIGSAQKPLPALLQALEHKTGVRDIGGLCFKDGTEVVVNMPHTLAEDFTTLPFPARHLLNNEKYSTIISKKKNFTIMITSKGCPSKCGFCHVGNIPYSSRPADAVVDEIEECYTRHGIREIEFFDPVFTYDEERVHAICAEIVRCGLSLSWACRARVDQMNEKLLAAMARAGCHRIYYGIECGNQQILDGQNKGITLDMIRKTIALTKKQGILTLGFFLFGSPGETKDTMKQTIRFACSLGLDYAQFHKIVAKPTTALAKELTRASGIDYWREFVCGTVEERVLDTPWTDLSVEDIERAVVKAYRRFYFSPQRFVRLVCSVRSWAECKRYARSVLGLLTTKSDIVKSEVG